MKLRFGLLLALSVAVPGVALADDIDDAIKARQGFYKLVGHNAGALFAMAKGEVDYDAAKAAAHAKNIQMLSEMDTATLWPMGSSKEDRPGKTRALQVTWDTYPAVLEKGKAFKAAAADLAGSAGEGLDGLRGKIGALGASCKGCHETYRAKDF